MGESPTIAHVRRSRPASWLLQPIDVELGEPVCSDDCFVEPVAVVRVDEELHVVADRLPDCADPLQIISKRRAPDLSS